MKRKPGMLLLSHMSELMEKTLRRQREPLDGRALGASILLHALLLGVMAFVHFKAPTEPREIIVKIHLKDLPDAKPVQLAQATGEKPKPIKLTRPKPPKLVKRQT